MLLLDTLLCSKRALNESLNNSLFPLLFFFFFFSHFVLVGVWCVQYGFSFFICFLSVIDLSIESLNWKREREGGGEGER